MLWLTASAWIHLREPLTPQLFRAYVTPELHFCLWLKATNALGEGGYKCYLCLTAAGKSSLMFTLFGKTFTMFCRWCFQTELEMLECALKKTDDWYFPCVSVSSAVVALLAHLTLIRWNEVYFWTEYKVKASAGRFYAISNVWMDRLFWNVLLLVLLSFLTWTHCCKYYW